MLGFLDNRINWQSLNKVLQSQMCVAVFEWFVSGLIKIIFKFYVTMNLNLSNIIVTKVEQHL